MDSASAVWVLQINKVDAIDLDSDCVSGHLDVNWFLDVLINEC